MSPPVLRLRRAPADALSLLARSEGLRAWLEVIESLSLACLAITDSFPAVQFSKARLPFPPSPNVREASLTTFSLTENDRRAQRREAQSEGRGEEEGGLSSVEGEFTRARVTPAARLKGESGG